jgi:hypothetical protein
MATIDFETEKLRLGLSLMMIVSVCAGCQPRYSAQVGGETVVGTSEEVSAAIRRDQQRRQQEAEERANELKRQRAEQSAIYEANRMKENERLAAAIQKKVEEDESLGYKHMSFTDFELDKKTMRQGTKLAVKGFYRAKGKLETLAETILPTATEIVLLTETAPRGTRKRLLECRDRFCSMTVLGHVEKCNVTWLGRPVSSEVCLVVENTWELASKPFY